MPRIKQSKSRNMRGTVIVEEVSALVVICPLVMLLIFVSIEIHSFLLVRNCLDESARVASRNCAMAYHWPSFGTGAVPVGQPYSPDAQGDTVAPPTTSSTTPEPSPEIKGSDGAVAQAGQPRTANEAFAKVRVNGIITKNSQFSAVYTPASVNNISAPQYLNGHVKVKVSCKFADLPFFDPLSLKSFINPEVSASATYSL